MTDEELREIDELLRRTPRQKPPDTGCPSTDIWRRFIATTLPQEEMEQMRDHLVACSRCARGVMRLYDGIKYIEEKQKAAMPRIPRMVMSFLGGLFRAPMVQRGLAAVAVTALILCAVWQLRPPRKVQMAEDKSDQRSSAPQVVRKPEPNILPSPPIPQTRPAPSRQKEQPAPRSSQKPRRQPPSRPQLLVMSDWKMTAGEKEFEGMRPLLAAEVRGSEQAGAPALKSKLFYSTILTPRPELAAEPSPGVTGPFFRWLEEVRIMRGTLEVVKEDVEGTKDKPLDAPTLPLTKPLERGKVYR